jgi:hypothetical protein
VILCKHQKIGCETRSVPSGVAKSVLMLFPVEHMNAQDRAVVRNQLTETPSTCLSNRLGGVLTALDRRDIENLDSLLREGPHREQCT